MEYFRRESKKRRLDGKLKMKANVIVYGLGGYFENVCERGDCIREYYNITGYCDRDSRFADTVKDYAAPSELRDKEYDFIVITSIYYREIIDDLVKKYGVSSEKIIIWEEERSRRDYLNHCGTQFVFGQFGEDYCIGTLLKEKGIKLEDADYIEVGVDNPFMNNHTYFLHLSGAKGILVDANPESIDLIKAVRKGQKVLNHIISDKKGKAAFYISNIPSLSSMDIENIKFNQGEVKEKIILDAVSINDILAMQDKTAVLSIDLEGYDKRALTSIDFKRYQPEIICAEVGKPDKELAEYMKGKGYLLVFCNYINSIWKKQDNQAHSRRGFNQPGIC